MQSSLHMRTLLAVCLFSLTAWAQPALSLADQAFVTTAANTGLAEVEMGRLAAKLGLNKDIRKFGARLVAEREKANKELQRVVMPYEVLLPTKPDEAQQKHIDRLAMLMGVDFDSAFSKHMLGSHENEVKLFEAEARGGQAAALKAFATETLPALRAHLKAAEELTQPRLTSL